MLDNLRLGFTLGDDGGATIALSEAGSGIQSGVLLALHRLEQKAAENPAIQFILAVEEPEAFLHPQKQKELYQDILNAQSKNLRIVVTTHSPYIVGETPFSKLGLVKKQDKHCTLYLPDVKTKQDEETFDAYSDEVNASLFFADKVVLVEGESDARVLKLLLQKKFGGQAYRISIISASGNKNFSPFLRMIRAWNTAKIPHLIVTDFDSLTKSTDRAILVGAKAAGYSLTGETALHSKVDAALDKGEAEFASAAADASSLFEAAGLKVFIFSSDLENALISATNKQQAATILNEVAQNNNYTSGYDLNQLKRQIGSKGIPLNPMDKPPFKKPFIHRKIADTINLDSAHPDIKHLLDLVESL